MSESHRSLIPNDLDRAGRYHLMTACVVPRPIAWTSTLSSSGISNLAPFSFFGGVSSDPWTVMLSVGRRRDGSHKDTSQNLIDNSEAVIHISTRENEREMVASSLRLDPPAPVSRLLQTAIPCNHGSRCIQTAGRRGTRANSKDCGGSTKGECGRFDRRRGRAD